MLPPFVPRQADPHSFPLHFFDRPKSHLPSNPTCRLLSHSLHDRSIQTISSTSPHSTSVSQLLQHIICFDLTVTSVSPSSPPTFKHHLTLPRPGSSSHNSLSFHVFSLVFSVFFPSGARHGSSHPSCQPHCPDHPDLQTRTAFPRFNGRYPAEYRCYVTPAPQVLQSRASRGSQSCRSFEHTGS